MASFSDLLEKLGRGQTLNPSELSQLRNEARAVEETKNAVKGWLQPGSVDPKFNQVQAEGGRFLNPPLSGAWVQFITEAPLVVANNTETLIPFDAIWGKPSSLRIDGDTFYTLVPGKFYVVVGNVAWESNGTGDRGLFIKAYDQADVLQWGLTLHNLVPSGVDYDNMPFAGAFGITFENAYIQFEVLQTSGGDLDLLNASMAIFELTFDRGL